MKLILWLECSYVWYQSSWHTDVSPTVWFVKNNTDLICLITKYSGLIGKQLLHYTSRLDSSFSNRVSNHPKEMNFIAKLKWWHTIAPNLIRDRCTSRLISSILLNGDGSISLHQRYPKCNLNIILLNLWWYHVIFSFLFLFGW